MNLDWENLRFFLAVAREGSLAGAGRRLRLDATTVGRRIGAMEDALRVALFRRQRDRWVLTPAGERVLPVAERIETSVVQLQQAAQSEGEALSGRVRLTLMEELAVRLVIPRAMELRARLPGVRLDLLCTTRTLDLARGEADLALRLSRPTEPDLKARRLGMLCERPYASRVYLHARGLEANFDNLDGHDVVLLLTGERERWTDSLGTVRPVLRATSPAASWEAIALGLGVGLVPEVIAADDPRLVALPGLPVRRDHEMWLVGTGSAFEVPSIRAVADALIALVAG